MSLKEFRIYWGQNRPLKTTALEGIKCAFCRDDITYKPAIYLRMSAVEKWENEKVIVMPPAQVYNHPNVDNRYLCEDCSLKSYILIAHWHDDEKEWLYYCPLYVFQSKSKAIEQLSLILQRSLPEVFPRQKFYAIFMLSDVAI